jgi:cytochrome c
LKWTDGNLDKWLKGPSGFAPGNSMAFAGLTSQKDRADVISFLKGG